MPGCSHSLCWLVLSACTLGASQAQAMGWLEQSELMAVAATSGTRLIGVQQGTEQSAKVRDLSLHSYELADGEAAGVSGWYRPSWTDTALTFLTPLRTDVGLIWGFSTGERGPKYRIQPSLQVGLLVLGQLGPRTQWSFRATTLLGGRIKERTCVADYGEIGGVQEVNCRMAASEMQPSETLQYLINERPENRTRITLRLSHDF